ncbi:hypothetical protein MCERE19_03646 [Spirosomataceae bacterium]
MDFPFWVKLYYSYLIEKNNGIEPYFARSIF